MQAFLYSLAASPAAQAILNLGPLEVPGGEGGGTLPGNGYEVYIPWDLGLFYDGIGQLYEKLGVGINIGFWIFLIVSGVYLIFNLVDRLGK